MKQHSISHPVAMGSPHARRDSQASAHSEAVSHGGSGHNRGGYQGGRGRGGYAPQYNNNQTMGYPPSRPFQGPNAGRGGMQPYHQGRGGMPQYPNSPQPPRASPATTPAMPHHGTPTMPPAALAPNQPYYSPQMNMYPAHQQVKPPFITNDLPFKQNKKSKAARRDSNKNFQQAHNSSQKPLGNGPPHKARRESKRWDFGAEFRPGAIIASQPSTDFADGPAPSYAFAPSRAVPMQPPSLLPTHMSHLLQGGAMGQIDLSPASGNFEQLLTEQHKQMNAPYGVAPPPIDGYRANMMMPGYGYPQQMPYMGQPQQANPAFHQPFIPQYNQGQAAAPAMSRNPSQVSDRPTSSTGQNQAPVITQGTPHQRPAQPAAAPAIVSSTNFTRPKKTNPIVIKDAQGKILDLTAVKAPSSPAPSIQQSKTPPVIASTPTPPPKPSTPSHARTDSASASSKTKEQVRDEFKKLVQKTAEGPADIKAKEEDVAKAAAEEKAQEEERLKEEERLAAEKKAEEEAKTAEDAKAKEAADAEAKKAEEERKKKEEDDEMERMIKEMEEEDARREAEQEEISKKKKAEAEERKKREDAERVANAADADRKLREQEREMERLEEEKERKRAAGGAVSVADLLSKNLDELTLTEKKDSSKPASPALGESGSLAGAKAGAAEKQGRKPVPLNLSPLITKPVEAPQPSAALQSLKSSRFLPGIEYDIYPAGISSPNPALNQAVAKKGKVFKYDAQFLLQFQGVFTEQPSMEFHQQVKTLIGDTDGSRSASARTPGAGSARQGSRSGATGGFPQQGAMGQFGAKTLPPGTTSEQRFAMSQGSGSMPRPGSMTGMAFGRTGAFPGQLSRTPSSTNAAGIPHSPRQGSRRGGSKREFGGKGNEAQAAKTMPLTAGMELKPITTSASGWKPTSIGKPAAASAVVPGHMDPAMVQRKVKAALNKMTPEKFDKISDGILEIASQSKNEQDGRTLRQVIQLTFEKATDEAHWASMYAKFCKRMLEMMSPEIRDENILHKNGEVVSGGALFRKYLLNRCQEEFERGWKIDLPDMKDSGDKKAQEAALLSDEYYIAAAAKRRGLGLVQFIGELFKLGMLTERIMHECVRKLLEFQGVPDEAEIESLTKLLRTVGGVLDSTEKGRPMMEAYFQRIDTIIQLPELPSRLKFMLMDIVDLRRARWASKDNNKGPKTLDEVRAEVR
jgi:translation initiation factor 4G